MSPATKILLVVLLVLAAAAAVYTLATGGAGSGDGPGPFVPAEPPVGPAAPGGAAETRREPPAAAHGEGPGARQAVGVAEAYPSGAEFAQGVRGRAVDATGTPLPGIRVYLMRGRPTDLFAMMRLATDSVSYPPLSSVETGADARFALGVRDLRLGPTYELRFTSEHFADHSVPALTLFAEQWYDAGDVALARGVAVHGQVVAAGSGAPIRGAEVSIRPPTASPDPSPTPGRERGIVTATDAGGFYRLDNVASGAVTIAALAAGFAKVEQARVEVTERGDNRFDFELPPGVAIAGVVTDGDGHPIPNAEVTAIALSLKTPLTEAVRSDRSGRFELLGLTAVPFRLKVGARGYIPREIVPVRPGHADEHVVLERQGIARLRVESPTGQLLFAYDALLKIYFAEQQSHGHAPGAETHHVEQRDLDDGVYTMTGITPGHYVFEVNARGFAKTYSEPFEVALHADGPTVLVRMLEGGSLEGTVLGHDAEPLGGALVATLPDFLDENPLSNMLIGAVPIKITRTWTKTDESGRYAFARLAPGTYQLKFSHPEHTDTFQKGHQVEEARTTAVPPVQLARGTLISGTARVDGVPAGQIKVNVSALPDPQRPGALPFSTSAVTDGEGRFTLPVRVRPGGYQAHAARQGNPFVQIGDYGKTQQEFTVAAGQDTFTVHFDIRTN